MACGESAGSARTGKMRTWLPLDFGSCHCRLRLLASRSSRRALRGAVREKIFALNGLLAG